MSNTNKIKITTLIDPNEFYFKFLDNARHDENCRKIRDIESKISRMRYDNSSVFNVGEIYACYNERWKKWVRGRLINKLRDGQCNFFLIDHGFFKYCGRFFQLPKEFAFSLNNIQRGSLPITNASHSEKWNEVVMTICNNLNNMRDNMVVNFILIYEEESNEIQIGDLFVIDNNEKYSLTKKLLATGGANKNQTFNDIFSKLSNRNVKIPNCQRTPKQKMEFFTSSANAEKIISEKLITFGHNLENACLSVNDLRLNGALKHFVCKQSAKMSDIQSFMWPQINSGRNSLIITTNQDDLTFSYLVPLLNNLSNDPCVNANNTGPMAIIFAQNSQKANEIEKVCWSYGINFKILKAVNMCDDKKFELFSGCALLIATPPAFTRITKNIAIGIIDENRLKHVVYDNFYEMSKKFENHISRSIQLIMSFSKRPQIVITSDVLSNEMKHKLVKQLSEAVLCIDDYMEAATYAGMALSIEITKSMENKFQLLLDDSSIVTNKTMIIVNDDHTANDLCNQLSMKGMKVITCDDSEAVRAWDEDDKVDSILIATDLSLLNHKIRSIQYLIHFDMPASWKKLSKRFQVLENGIYKKLDEKEVPLKTLVLLGEENLSDFENLLHFLNTRHPSKEREDVLKNIKMNQERLKCHQNVTLCNKLLQFGKCDSIVCTNRHILTDQDKPQSHLPPPKCLIKFDLISVQTPTNFLIKIKEHLLNGKWLSRDEANKVVQQRLDVSMQSYCMKNDCRLEMGDGIMGEVYAKYDDKLSKWIRCKIIERVSPQVVKVFNIDYGTSSPIIEMKLLNLSGEFASLESAISHLNIIGLVPFDGENYYEDFHTQKMKEYINKLPKHVVFVCKVQAAISDTFKDIVLTETFEGKCNTSVKFQLKKHHMRTNISETDTDASRRILEQISSLQNHFDDEEKSIPVNCIQSLKLIEAEKSKNYDDIKWKQLSLGKNYSINVQHFISPYSFFIVLNNPDNLTLKNALKLIEECDASDPLTHFEVGACCLYQNESEKKNRAVILSLDEDACEILLADYGTIQKCQKAELVEIPAKLLNQQLQAIHCKMLGVRPKFNMTIWPKKQCEAIKILIDEFNDGSLKMRAVKNDLSVKKFNEIGIKCYEVVLFDKNSKIRLDKMAIKRRVVDTTINVETQNDLEFIDSDDDNDNYDDYNGGIEDYYDDNKLTIITNTSESDSGLFTEELPFNFKIDDFDSVVSMSEDNSSTENSIKSSIKSDSDNLTCAIATTSLKNLFKQPHIEWRQNDLMIYLLLSARDCKEYSLRIDESSFEVIIQNSDATLQRTIIQLYGLIRTEISSHEFTGSNIVVRLPKKCFISWPRLIMHNEKSQFIKFSSENVPFKYQSCNYDNYSTTSKFNSRSYSDSDNDESESDDKEFQLSSDDEC